MSAIGLHNYILVINCICFTVDIRKHFNVQVKTTYVKTSMPQPAMAVKILGERSRAGLMAYPQFIPNVMPIVVTTRPIKSGVKLDDGAEFLLSVSAITNSSNIIVP